MTALALAPDTRNGYEPAAAAGVDRAIRVSTAVAVLAVAGVAAYVSYWHAYAVVCAHGETGVTARLEPATIDGLVYASSMVNLYAARHRLPVPALARWLLALGIVATLAANMAQGWSHGPVGAVIAAWPAVSLVGSYELLVWIIRTAAAGDLDRGPVADQGGPQAGHHGTSLRLAAAQGPDFGPGNLIGQVAGLTPGGADDPPPVSGMTPAGQVDGPDWNAAGHADQTADQSSGPPGPVTTVSPGGDTNAAAVAAYRASLQAGRPLSERKLAGQFEDLQALGAQPDGRSPPESVPGLASWRTVIVGGTPPANCLAGFPHDAHFIAIPGRDGLTLETPDPVCALTCCYARLSDTKDEAKGVITDRYHAHHRFTAPSEQ